MYCFNCSESYKTTELHMKGILNHMYCSVECADEDNARLVEGNGIVASAIANEALTPIQKAAYMTVSGPIAQTLKIMAYGKEIMSQSHGNSQSPSFIVDSVTQHYEQEHANSIEEAFERDGAD